MDFETAVGARSIKAVFFDLGGTLIYNEPDADVMYSEVLAKFGIAREPAVIKKVTGDLGAEIGAFGPSTQEAEKEFWWRFDTEVARRLRYDVKPGLLKALGHAFRHEIKAIVYPDVLPTLEALHAKGVRLGIISNANFEILERLDALSLTQHFDSITYSAAVGANKPDRRIFEAALESLRVPAEQAAHIGDSYEADFLGAQAAGLLAIWLDRQGENEHLSIRVTNLLDSLPLLE